MARVRARRMDGYVRVSKVGGREGAVERVHEPTRAGLDLLGRRTERQRTPPAERVDHLPQALAVLGQIVDRRCGRRRQPPAVDDAMLLEMLEPRREDVRRTREPLV